LSDNDRDVDSTKKETAEGDGSPEDFIDLDEDVEA
jgi:hypothetical protein